MKQGIKLRDRLLSQLQESLTKEGGGKVIFDASIQSPNELIRHNFDIPDRFAKYPELSDVMIGAFLDSVVDQHLGRCSLSGLPIKTNLRINICGLRKERLAEKKMWRLMFDGYLASV